jgi:putative peptidoglycan lipid II flippase
MQVNQDTQKRIEKSSILFFLGTVLSRFSGLIRDVVISFCFGASPSLASFMVAFRLSNLFRRLLGESFLNLSVLPFFEEKKKKSFDEAFQFYKNLFFAIFCLICFFVCIFLFSSYFIYQTAISADAKNILFLSCMMLPGLVFISLFGLNNAVLQSFNKYFISASASIFFNLFWILGAVFSKNMQSSAAMKILAISINCGFFMQMFVSFLPTYKIFKKHVTKGVRFFCFKNSSQKIFSRDLKKLLKPMILTIIGIGAMQINSAIDAIFAKIADSSGPAYLWYAIRLNQLPMALFAISITSALFPSMTRSIQNSENSKYLEFLKKGLINSFTLMCFSTFGVFSLGAISINLIYGREKFTNVAFLETSRCLYGYAIGLVFASLVLILANTFYAKKRYLHPTKASIVAVVCNICLNTFFVFVLGYKSFSIALSTSIGSIINFFYLYRKLEDFEKNIFKSNFLKFFKIFLVFFFSAGITIIASQYLQDNSLNIFLNYKNVILEKSFFTILSKLILQFFIYFGSVLFFCKIFKLHYIFITFSKLLNKAKAFLGR